MKRSTGFSLVELMIAVVILGILAAVAMPSFATFIRNTQIRSAAESLQAGLNLARTEALRRNAHVSFWMVRDLTATCARGASATSWVVSMVNPAGQCNVDPSDTVAPQTIQSHSGGDGASVVSIAATDSGNAATSCITFNGFGQVQSACTGGGNPIATVKLTPAVATTGAAALQIRVTPGGAIRMCSEAAVAGDPAYCG